MIGRRSDGYHELRTLFQTIDLHDLVTVALGESGIRLVLEEGSAPAGAENLAWRAAAGFLERWGAAGAGVDIGLAKRLPMGGGLGAGSSNAATVLEALRELTGRPRDRAELWPLARQLGADVPFFLVHGTALGVGRGDEVIPLPDLEPEELVVVVPPIAVPTAEAFARLELADARPIAPSLLALAAGAGGRPSELVAWNDFQEPVLGWYPAVAQVYNALLDAGARVVRLSGTGSTLFGFFEEPPSVGAIRKRMPVGSQVYGAKTLSRREAVRQRVEP